MSAEHSVVGHRRDDAHLVGTHRFSLPPVLSQMQCLVHSTCKVDSCMCALVPDDHELFHVQPIDVGYKRRKRPTALQEVVSNTLKKSKQYDSGVVAVTEMAENEKSTGSGIFPDAPRAGQSDNSWYLRDSKRELLLPRTTHSSEVHHIVLPRAIITHNPHAVASLQQPSDAASRKSSSGASSLEMGVLSAPSQGSNAPSTTLSSPISSQSSNFPSDASGSCCRTAMFERIPNIGAFASESPEANPKARRSVPTWLLLSMFPAHPSLYRMLLSRIQSMFNAALHDYKEVETQTAQDTRSEGESEPWITVCNRLHDAIDPKLHVTGYETVDLDEISLCVICQDTVEPHEMAVLVNSRCPHVCFHFSCISLWSDRSRTCPLCVQPFHGILQVQFPHSKLWDTKFAEGVQDLPSPASLAENDNPGQSQLETPIVVDEDVADESNSDTVTDTVAEAVVPSVIILKPGASCETPTKNADSPKETINDSMSNANSDQNSVDILNKCAVYSYATARTWFLSVLLECVRILQRYTCNTALPQSPEPSESALLLTYGDCPQPLLPVFSTLVSGVCRILGAVVEPAVLDRSTRARVETDVNWTYCFSSKLRYQGKQLQIHARLLYTIFVTLDRFLSLTLNGLLSVFHDERVVSSNADPWAAQSLFCFPAVITNEQSFMHFEIPTAPLSPNATFSSPFSTSSSTSSSSSQEVTLRRSTRVRNTPTPPNETVSQRSSARLARNAQDRTGRRARNSSGGSNSSAEMSPTMTECAACFDVSKRSEMLRCAACSNMYIHDTCMDPFDSNPAWICAECASNHFLSLCDVKKYPQDFVSEFGNAVCHFERLSSTSPENRIQDETKYASQMDTPLLALPLHWKATSHVPTDAHALLHWTYFQLFTAAQTKLMLCAFLPLAAVGRADAPLDAETGARGFHSLPERDDSDEDSDEFDYSEDVTTSEEEESSEDESYYSSDGEWFTGFRANPFGSGPTRRSRTRRQASRPTSALTTPTPRSTATRTRGRTRNRGGASLRNFISESDSDFSMSESDFRRGTRSRSQSSISAAVSAAVNAVIAAASARNRRRGVVADSDTENTSTESERDTETEVSSSARDEATIRAMFAYTSNESSGGDGANEPRVPGRSGGSVASRPSDPPVVHEQRMAVDADRYHQTIWDNRTDALGRSWFLPLRNWEKAGESFVQNVLDTVLDECTTTIGLLESIGDDARFTMQSLHSVSHECSNKILEFAKRMPLMALRALSNSEPQVRSPATAANAANPENSEEYRKFQSVLEDYCKSVVDAGFQYLTQLCVSSAAIHRVSYILPMGIASIVLQGLFYCLFTSDGIVHASYKNHSSNVHLFVKGAKAAYEKSRETGLFLPHFGRRIVVDNAHIPAHCDLYPITKVCPENDAPKTRILPFRPSENTPSLPTVFDLYAIGQGNTESNRGSGQSLGWPTAAASVAAPAASNRVANSRNPNSPHASPTVVLPSSLHRMRAQHISQTSTASNASNRSSNNGSSSGSGSGAVSRPTLRQASQGLTPPFPSKPRPSTGGSRGTPVSSVAAASRTLSAAPSTPALVAVPTKRTGSAAATPTSASSSSSSSSSMSLCSTSSMQGPPPPPLPSVRRDTAQSSQTHSRGASSVTTRPSTSISPRTRSDIPIIAVNSSNRAGNNNSNDNINIDAPVPPVIPAIPKKSSLGHGATANTSGANAAASTPAPASLPSASMARARGTGSERVSDNAMSSSRVAPSQSSVISSSQSRQQTNQNKRPTTSLTSMMQSMLDCNNPLSSQAFRQEALRREHERGNIGQHVVISSATPHSRLPATSSNTHSQK